MHPLELLAVVLAILVLAKIVTVIVSPRAWFRFVHPVYASPIISSIIFAILFLVTAKYVLAEVTVVQIGAVVLSLTFLLGLSFFPYLTSIKKLRDEVIRQGVGRAWLPLIIWTVFAVWILSEVF